ncbi:hypothetical protein FO456_12035 [Staphylococcus lugdunensis]|nr:hypothetical protein FO458_09155 [Staphylococcus lugdunensis]QEX34930.1 hypothetical protein FO456_11765 [Staphylococcus lugdunensis]QEX34934.1 hypothetical protein FO456_12035 [Staphylococcus lugdunensis]
MLLTREPLPNNKLNALDNTKIVDCPKPNLATNAANLVINGAIKVVTPTILGINAIKAPPRDIETPSTLAIAGCVSNNLANQPAKAVTAFKTCAAIGAIAIPKLTKAIAMLPINCMITGPFWFIY